MRFGGPELFEDLVHEAGVFALFSEIFFNGRPQSGVAHRFQRELITNGRKLFRDRMRGQQPRQRLRVMRLDATFDHAVMATKFILSGTLDKFPRLQIVLPHAGGAFPYLAGRVDHGSCGLATVLEFPDHGRAWFLFHRAVRSRFRARQQAPA